MELSLVALLVIGILLASLTVMKRRQRGSTAPSAGDDLEHAAQTEQEELATSGLSDPESTQVRSCPVCLTEYPAENHFCVRDGAVLMDGPPTGPFAQGMICPTCRRGYPADAGFCPDDADELVPYGLFGAETSSQPPRRLDSTKICPECGDRHASVHVFCGRDGAELVVVN